MHIATYLYASDKVTAMYINVLQLCILQLAEFEYASKESLSFTHASAS